MNGWLGRNEDGVTPGVFLILKEKCLINEAFDEKHINMEGMQLSKRHWTYSGYYYVC